MPDPTIPCLTCDGKLHVSFESGKRWESCGRCGLQLADGKPVQAPKDADAITLQRLGFPVEKEDVAAAHKARAASKKSA